LDIKIVTAYYLPTTNAASIRLSSFVENWKNESNINISILTSRNNDSKSFSDVEETFITLADNDSRFIVRLLFEILFSIEVFLRLLFSADKVYFVSSPPFLLTLSILLVSKIKNNEYILDIRDLYPEVLFNLDIIDKKSIPAKILLFLEGKIYDNALLISSVTNGLVDHIKKKTDNDNVYLIRNGYDKNLFYKNKKEKNNSDFKIMFHGTMGKFQNINLLIEIAKLLLEKNLSDVRIIVVGDGAKSDYLVDKINKLDLSNIEYLGHKDFKKIPAIINKCDIGISPRIDGIISKTAFPVKVYEYLGCRKPIIITPLSEVGKFIEKNEIGFQSENDPQMILELITKLKEDKELYNKFVQNIDKIGQDFERTQIADKFLNLIKKKVPVE
jgi:glycosyltransferase involved in cell wall biosynthesis